MTFFLSFLFWESSFLFPLKMISILIHEFWHSLVGIFFNVNGVEFHIYQNETGKTIINGSISSFGFILTAIAGYIGTTFTGSFFLNFFLKENLKELIFFIFCSLLFLISFILVSIPSLGFYTSLGWFFLLIITYFFKKEISYIIFVIIQSFLIFYGFYDLFDFSNNPYSSDLGILYQYLEKKGYYNGDFKNFIYFSSFIIVSINVYIFYKFILSSIFYNLIPQEKDEFKKESLEQSQEIQTPENFDSAIRKEINQIVYSETNQQNQINKKL